MEAVPLFLSLPRVYRDAMSSTSLIADLCHLSVQLTIDSSVPTATDDSNLASHFLDLVTLASAPPLLWPRLSEALESCFGTYAEIDVRAMEAGRYGLNLVVLAFQKEERDGGREEDELGEKIERSTWLVKFLAAAFKAL